MARLSKTHRFTIYEDTGIPTPEPTDENVFDDITTPNYEDDAHIEEKEDSDIIDGQGDNVQKQASQARAQVQDAANADNERRESAVTTTSISSFPESTYQTDGTAAPAQQANAPKIIRPSFRRPESVRRMQMGSPPSLGTRSPRESILSYYRSRTNTPRSVRSANSKGSPRRRRKISERIEDQQEVEEEKEYPLILLHVTLLPITFPWSMESMQELLPSSVIDNLQLLRSKVSDTVLQRGILIPHPREEYELLEERLLEALELKHERVTKCGHFNGRNSTGSETSREDSGRDSDSGLGSSVDEPVEELCAICQHHIRPQKCGMPAKNGRWSIKVFAANGLMRSAAWSAAWPEMESVDVEILPWIGDDIRKRLDERRAEEEIEEHERLEDEEARIKDIVDEQVRLAYEERRSAEDTAEHMSRQHLDLQLYTAKPGIEICDANAPSAQSVVERPHASPPADLPQIYRPSQIPLSVLLKNYLFLLAQDRRNVAMFILSTMVLFFAVRSGFGANQSALSNSDTTFASYLPPMPSSFAVSNATAEFFAGLNEPDLDDMEMHAETGSAAAEYAESEAPRDVAVDIESMEEPEGSVGESERDEPPSETNFILESSEEELIEMMM